LASAALSQVIDRLPPEILAQLDAHMQQKRAGIEPNTGPDPQQVLELLNLPLEARVLTSAEHEKSQARHEQMIHDACQDTIPPR